MEATGMRVTRFSLAAVLALAGLPLLAGAALADTREQVLLRLPGCSNAAEQRQYLDCYYAAVQPLRTELGLAAAPQASAYAAYFASGGVPASGGVSQQSLNVREEVLLRLTRCASIGDTRQYLDCYYAAAQPLRAELGLAPAPQAASYAPLFSLAQVAPRAAAPAAADTRPNLVPQGAYAMASTARPPVQPRLAGDAGATRLPFLGSMLGLKATKVLPDQFGLRNAKANSAGVDHIAARVSKISINRETGDFVVTLDNGQVWKQIMNDDARQRWSKKVIGAVATIAYGAGLTFNLRSSGSADPHLTGSCSAT
jgi:hypothetical protein